MKSIASLAVCLSLSFAFLIGSAVAQDREGGRRGPRDGAREGGREGGQRGGGFQRGRGGPPPSPIQTALDADNDGEISASELENAVAVLKALDKNKDGKLSGDEIRPAGGFGRGRGGPAGPGGGDDFVARLMERDANKDGKLSADEIPSFLADRLERMDTNGDKAIDKEELEAAARAMGRRGGPGGGPGGGGGFRGGRPGGGGGGDRPARPQRPGSDN